MIETISMSETFAEFSPMAGELRPLTAGEIDSVAGGAISIPKVSAPAVAAAVGLQAAFTFAFGRSATAFVNQAQTAFAQSSS
jgi:hypothetical protein